MKYLLILVFALGMIWPAMALARDLRCDYRSLRGNAGNIATAVFIALVGGFAIVMVMTPG